MKKVVSILLTVVMLATMMSAVLAAGNLPTIGGSEVVPSGLQGGATKILGIIQWVGYAFALGMLIYIGIKYTMSAANEKADLKKGAINYVIGAVLIAGAATVCGWLADFGAGL